MRIDLDSGTETISLDGIVISLSLLKDLVNPDDASLYAINRKGNMVTMTRVGFRNVSDYPRVDA
jgi:hypothetical protein